MFSGKTFRRISVMPFDSICNLCVAIFSMKLSMIYPIIPTHITFCQGCSNKGNHSFQSFVTGTAVNGRVKRRIGVSKRICHLCHGVATVLCSQLY